MLLSGYLILSPTGELDTKAPLCLFKSRRNAETSGFASFGREGFSIQSARPFFATLYGRTCLALIRKREREGYYNSKPKPLDTPATPLSLSGLSAMGKLQALLAGQKAAKRLRDLHNGVDTAIQRDNRVSGKSLSKEERDRQALAKQMLSTGERQDAERAKLSSAVDVPKEPETDKSICLLRILQCHPAFPLIDKKSRIRAEVRKAEKKLNSFGRKKIPQDKLEACRLDCLILFRAGKDVSKFVKRLQLTNTNK